MSGSGPAATRLYSTLVAWSVRVRTPGPLHVVILDRIGSWERARFFQPGLECLTDSEWVEEWKLKWRGTLTERGEIQLAKIAVAALNERMDNAKV